MGINNLLPALKTIVKARKISDYANQTVAVDTYCWLHKAVYARSSENGPGDIDELVRYCLRRVEKFQAYGIRVVMVFDGGKLPMKMETEDSREKKRAECHEKAQEFLKVGNIDKATQKMIEGFDVTPQIANKLLHALKNRNIECIVAPYEADAQLAYLSRTNYVDVIITEDSDLLAFGAKKILYKLDSNYNGQEISLADLPLCCDYSFVGWTENQFLTLCIMSGCDYLQSINGVGFKTAFNQVARYKNYRLVISHFMQSGKHQVPDDYVKKFEQAFMTFRFQSVFDPINRKIVHLNNRSEAIEKKLVEPTMEKLLDESLDYLGFQYEDIVACEIADGIICPIELRRFEHLEPLKIPQYGKNHQEKQRFILARPANSISSQDSQGEKKQTNLDSYFKKKQKLIHPALQEEPQTIQPTKMKPFKTPTQVKNSESASTQHQNSNPVIRLADGEVKSFSQDLLTTRIAYTDYGDLMIERITFNPTYQFEY